MNMNINTKKLYKLINSVKEYEKIINESKNLTKEQKKEILNRELNNPKKEIKNFINKIFKYDEEITNINKEIYKIKEIYINISNNNLKKIINVNSYLKNSNKKNYKKIIFYIKKEIDDKIINKIINEIIEEKFKKEKNFKIIVTNNGAVQLVNNGYKIIKKQNKQDVDKNYIKSIESYDFEPTPSSQPILEKKKNIKNNSPYVDPIFSEHLRPYYER